MRISDWSSDVCSSDLIILLMSEDKKTYQLLKVAKELNVSITTIADYLDDKGHAVDARPNTKIGEDLYQLLLKEYQSDKIYKEEATQDRKSTRLNSSH